MIGFDRGREPEPFRRASAARLAAAIAAYDAGGELDLDGYQGAKEALYAVQRKKCAWCENRTRFGGHPVDHYRPKRGAWRNRRGEPRQVSPDHYWWLAWTWTNLLFSCVTCNGQGNKGNYFRLAPGSAELPAPTRPIGAALPSVAFDVGAERPLLLDPSRDVFLDHIVWEPANTRHPRKVWTWTPRGLTDRGRETIDALQLEQLADDIQAHANAHVLPSVDEVDQHLHGRRSAQARNRWDTLVREVLSQDQPFTAATWCVLEHWMPRKKRAASGLAHPPRPR